MAKKPPRQKPAPVASPPAPSVVVTPSRGPGSLIALLVDSVSAKGVRCPAGTVIGPDVEGWPAHRVAAHLRNGLAAPVAEHGD